MSQDFVIIPIELSHVPMMVAAFQELGWPGKTEEQFVRYCNEQAEDKRVTLVALMAGEFAGYGNVIWESGYPNFKERSIPEIQDLNVLPKFRNQGIGSKLLDYLEERALETSSSIGIGVGLYSDYGAAQKLYVKRGYIPDGRGITHDGSYIEAGQSVPADDDLILWLIKNST